MNNQYRILKRSLCVCWLSFNWFRLQLARWLKLPPPGCPPKVHLAPFWYYREKNCSSSASLGECENKTCLLTVVLFVHLLSNVRNKTLIFIVTIRRFALLHYFLWLRPTPHITWTKDGESLPASPRIKVKHFNKMIQISKASFEDAGEYTCVATNKIGYIEHTITVRVKGETSTNMEYFLAVTYCLIKTCSLLNSGSLLVGKAHRSDFGPRGKWTVGVPFGWGSSSHCQLVH